MMATLQSRKRKNKLELYMNDVFEKECLFKIEQEEVEFIQTGIETLVKDLVDQIIAYGSFDKLMSDILTGESLDIIKEGKGNTNILMEESYKKNLAEVYFPIQSDCFLRRYVAENESYVKSVKSTIIKVGSFYDGTKNNFPDEFDFIIPLLGLRTSLFTHLTFSLNNHVHKATDVYGKSLHYTSLCEKHQVTRKLYFKKFKGIHGPAFKMQFIYSNGFGEQRPIHVDLVPAYKIIDSDTEFELSYVKPKTFHEEIMSAGSCLYIDEKLAFTEIEQHFMRNILSKKHVKVYRILKHLLNGNGDGEKLEEYLQVKGKHEAYYTSYRIKILIIYHHEVCTNTDTEDLGPCVLQVMEEMSTYESIDRFPDFTPSGYAKRMFCVLPYLKSTITTLQSMQTTEDSYTYERDKIRSLSGQYLDSCNST